jgi:hypothetical protein
MQNPYLNKLTPSERYVAEQKHQLRSLNKRTDTKSSWKERIAWGRAFVEQENFVRLDYNAWRKKVFPNWLEDDCQPLSGNARLAFILRRANPTFGLRSNLP